jgi:hypothetical protein
VERADRLRGLAPGRVVPAGDVHRQREDGAGDGARVVHGHDAGRDPGPQLLLHPSLDVLAQPHDLEQVGLRQRGQLVLDDTRDAVVLGVPRREARRDGAQRGHRVRLAVDGAVHELRGGLVPEAADLGQERDLGGEVHVQRGRAHAHARGDVAGRRGVVAALGERLRGRLDEPPGGRGRLLPSGARRGGGRLPAHASLSVVTAVRTED